MRHWEQEFGDWVTKHNPKTVAAVFAIGIAGVIGGSAFATTEIVSSSDDQINHELTKGLEAQVKRDGFTGEQGGFANSDPSIFSLGNTVNFTRLDLGKCKFLDVEAQVVWDDGFGYNMFDVNNYQLRTGRQVPGSELTQMGRVTIDFNNAQQLERQLPGSDCLPAK